jgi:DNA-binding CsgD family transcriptional regulator
MIAPGAVLGREDELAAVEAALAGDGARVLLLEGAFGSGKSTFLAAAARAGRDEGALVLGTRATEIAREHPFGVAFALTGPSRAGAAEEVRRALGGDPPDADDRPRVVAVVRALSAAITRLAEDRQVLVAVDDAHLADRPSLELLAHLAEVGQVTVVTTAAAGAVAAPEYEALARVAGGARRLSALGFEAAQDLVEREVPTDRQGSRVTARIVTACAGNPFLLTELSRAVARGEATAGGNPVPLPIAGRVRAELELTESDAAAFARALAVLGESAPLGMAAELSGLDIETADAAAERLADAGLAHGGALLSIVQPLTALAIESALSERERARLHGRAAEMLRRTGAPADRIAGHLLVGDRLGREWAVDVLSAAALRARDRRDHELAVEYDRRALEEPPSAEQRPAVVRDLAMAEADAGVPEAMERLREAIELLGDDHDERCRCRLRLGQLQMIAGDRDGALATLQRALEESDGVSEMMLDAVRSAQAVVQVNAREVRAHDRVKALDMLSPNYAGPMERSALAIQAMTGSFMLAIDHEEAIALCRRALAGGALLREESAGGVAMRFVTGTLVAADGLDLGIEVLDKLVAMERESGSLVGLTTALYSRAWQLYHTGRIEESLASIREALDDPPEAWVTYFPAARAALGLALLEQDRPEQAAVAVDVEPKPQWTGSILWPLIQVPQARIALANGRTKDALAIIEDVRGTEAMTGARNPALMDRGQVEILALLQAGDTEKARAVAEEDLERARTWGAPRTLGAALRGMALTTIDDDLGAALALLNEAVAVHERSPGQLERTRTLIELGIALRRADQRRAAREPLAQALEIADQLGLVALARRARDELALVGARPRRTALSGVASLTPAEYRAATLAAAGKTNREIAEELFVTIKAVEKHLRGAFGKLEITSRRELAEHLENEEPPDFVE